MISLATRGYVYPVQVVASGPTPVVKAAKEQSPQIRGSAKPANVTPKIVGSSSESG